ncbi:MAG: glycosyltransferase [Collinsella sp.]
MINNGIPINQFVYDVESDASLRDEFGIGRDDTVVGSVRRFVKQKNFEFGVRVFAEMKRCLPSAKWVILGAGDGMDRVKVLAEELGVGDSVIMPGVRVDVARFYSLFDAFFMPSLYERLPVSRCWAQASGLRCVFSTGVPERSDRRAMAGSLDLIGLLLNGYPLLSILLPKGVMTGRLINWLWLGTPQKPMQKN